ncbi:MAG: hypothetical protein ABSE49_30570 [Polyangiaceae bacterium]
MTRLATAGLSMVSVTLGSALAWGQEPPPPPPPRPAPPVVVAPPAPVAAPAETPAAPAAETESDPALWVHHLGVTYFDVTNLPIANPVTGGGGVPAPGGLTSSNVAAPVVGVRYWLTNRFGIDGGLGFGYASGSDQTVAGGTTTTVNKTGTTGFALHGGVPISLAEGKHYAFLVIPDFTVGFTTATYTPPTAAGATAGPNQSLSGFLFDIGARAGAEIYFGFIGLPQLALQATVGLSYRRSVYKLSSNGSSSSDGTNTFGTQVNADPWAIFQDAISATYYL